TVGSGALTINAVGITQTGAITQEAAAGTATFNGGSGAIVLTDAGNDFTGSVSLNSTADASVVDSNAIVLGNSTVGGNLAVTASGDITETGILVVTGTSTFTVDGAQNADVWLAPYPPYPPSATDHANDLAGAVTITTINGGTTRDIGLRNINPAANLAGIPTTARNLTIIFDNAPVVMPLTTLTGDLVVIAGGDISQVGVVTVAGTSSLNAGAHAITLDNTANDFTGAVTLINSGTNDIVVTDVNAIILGTSTIGSGALTVNAVGVTQVGPITQEAAVGTATSATFNGGTADIVLTDPGNDFTGPVSLNTTANASVVDSNAIILGASTVGGNLDVLAHGDITQLDSSVYAPLLVTGTATFTVDTIDPAVYPEGADVLLQFQPNDIAGAVTITTINGGSTRDIGIRNVNPSANLAGIPTIARNLTIIFDNAPVILPLTTLTGNLIVIAGGDISQVDVVTVAGTSSLNAGPHAITLDNPNNDFGGAVSLINTGPNNILINDINNIIFGTSTIGSGTLTVNAIGITQVGPITQEAAAGTATFNSGAGAIVLTDPGNDFTGPVVLNTTVSADASVVDSNAIILGASTVAGNLFVTAHGDITQVGVLLVSGNATFTIGALDPLVYPDGADVLLHTQPNDIAGLVTIQPVNDPADLTVAPNPPLIRDIGLRNVNPAASLDGIGPPIYARNFTIIFDNAPVILPETTLTGYMDITAGGMTSTSTAITETGVLTVAGTSTFTG
ncbi:MAG: hypothetical protein P8164_06150, partial [Gammaproteobacteria bacterium]